MNAFASAGIEPGPSALAGVAWSRCRAFLAWDFGQSGDADALFRVLVGRAPDHVVRNKFPTRTMPCRSWAGGREGSWSYDLRLGVHALRDEFEVSGHDTAMAPALERLRHACALLSRQSAAHPSLHVDLEQTGSEAKGTARAWSALQCPPADPAAHPHLVESEAAGHRRRLAGELIEAGGTPVFVLRAEILPLPGVISADPALLFEHLWPLLGRAD